MANPQQVGSFVPTTNIFAGEQQISTVEMNSPEFRQLLVNLYQIVGLIATVVNTKDSAWYTESEFVNGQVWFPNPTLNSTSQLTPAVRQVCRMTINFGALPNATTKSVPHNIPITSAVTFTRIYATASDTSANIYIPIPYIDMAGDNIGLDVDATNVNITTTVDRTNFTTCYVVLEYIKS